VALLALTTSILPYQGNSQNLDSIHIYEITNNNFISVLDSFVNHEKQYEYYSKDVTFSVNILDSNGTVFELNSGVLYQKAPILYSFQKDNPGIFLYNGHKFILTGRSIINGRIMRKTCNHQAVQIIDVSKLSNNANEDDSYFPTTWLCKLDKDSIPILSKSPMVRN